MLANFLRDGYNHTRDIYRCFVQDRIEILCEIPVRLKHSVV